MADFIPLCEMDTKELRKQLGLPITKDLIYYRHFGYDDEEIHKVIAYEPIFDYPESNSKTLKLTLENGENVNIHSMYLAEMQSAKSVEETNKNTTAVVEFKKIKSIPKNYILYDIETTGTNHLHDNIIEISAIKCENGNIVDEYSKLIAVDKALSKKITSLTGITDELLCAEGIKENEAIQGFFDFAENLPLVGHNIASFDNYFIKDAAEKMNKSISFGFVDTLTLARKLLKNLSSHKLEILSTYFGVSYEGAHRALQDCKINNEIYLRLAKLSGNEIIPIEIETHEIEKKEDDIFAHLIDNLNAVCEDLVRYLELPPNGLIVRKNNNGSVPSISICANEPPYPCLKENLGKLYVVSSLVLITRPSTQKDANKIIVTLNNPDDLERVQMPDTAEVKTQYKPKSEIINNYNIYFGEYDDSIIPYVKELIQIILKRYRTKENTFGCCSSFKKCSDAKKCIHENKLYSTACTYRSHLEEGRIFYGENANM